ncbi:hypothetical protein FOA52_011853 [Chlamydomonas sp. UWO 241]|nr:hypothetical protein FOA52_011853 [Chlamydomonas sp. UWO 241]
MQRFEVPVAGVRRRSSEAGGRIAAAWSLEREPDNPADANAIRVMAREDTGGSGSGSGSAWCLGHVPAAVALHLAPLLDWATATVRVRMVQPSAAPAPGGGQAPADASAADAAGDACAPQAQSSYAPPPPSRAADHQLTLLVEAWPTGASGMAGDGPDHVAQCLHAAAAAAAARSAATGEVLRDSFAMVVADVRAHDAHLLTRDEEGVLDAYECLLLRLLQRTPTWFQVSQITYAECPDVDADVDALTAARLLGAPRDALPLPSGDAGASSSGVEAEEQAQRSPGGAAGAAGGAGGAAGKAGSDGGGGDSVGWGPWDWGPLLSLLPVAQVRAMAVSCRLAQSPAAASGLSKTEVVGALARERRRAQRQRQQQQQRQGGEGGASECVGAQAGVSVGADASATCGDDLWSQLRAQVELQLGACVRLHPACTELFARLQRVYFLNEGLDLSRFVAARRGAAPYSRYVVQRSLSAFPTRRALLEYEDALRHAAALDDAITREDGAGTEAALAAAWDSIRSGRHHAAALAMGAGAVQGGEQTQEAGPSERAGDAGAAGTSDADAAGTSNADDVSASARSADADPACCRPRFLMRFCAPWMYAGMVTVAVSLLERARKYGEAADALRLLLAGGVCPGRRGGWWLRLSIDLEHTGGTEDALCAAEAGVADSWVKHGDLLALQRRVLRMGKPPRRWKRPAWAPRVMREPPEKTIPGRPINCVTGVKSRFYSEAGHQVGVEELALEYYASDAGGRWLGMHTEGGVWSTLFGLLMWDVLLAPVPNVFRTPFQTAPLDLGTEVFYHARREAADARLTEIASGYAQALVRACWEGRHGQWVRGVNWERYSLDHLLDICRCVGPLGLSVVCRMLCEDYNNWQGGMPDLLLWRPDKGDAKLSEVKGPRDRLSDHQRAWIHALMDVDVPCEVLRVAVPEASSSASRAASRATPAAATVEAPQAARQPSEQPKGGRGRAPSSGSPKPSSQPPAAAPEVMDLTGDEPVPGTSSNLNRQAPGSCSEPLVGGRASAHTRDSSRAPASARGWGKASAPRPSPAAPHAAGGQTSMYAFINTVP